jgi:DNA-binding transcriptional ArsR family regulator
MGRKSGSSTTLDILELLGQRPHAGWLQSELARALGVLPATIREHLKKLEAYGLVDLSPDVNLVQAKLRAQWAPSGVAMSLGLLTQVYRLLQRLPKSRERDELLQRVEAAVFEGAREKFLPLGEASDAGQVTSRETEFLAALEDSIATHKTIAVRYEKPAQTHADLAATSRPNPRLLSAAFLLVGPPARFIAFCHQSGIPKWFRVDRIATLRQANEPYVVVPQAELTRMRESSVHGYGTAEVPTEHRFIVSAKAAPWVSQNLPPKMVGELRQDGALRVTALTTAPMHVARFVVSLGREAKAETEALRAMVLALAQGALAGHEDAASEVKSKKSRAAKQAIKTNEVSP